LLPVTAATTLSITSMIVINLLYSQYNVNGGQTQYTAVDG